MQNEYFDYFSVYDGKLFDRASQIRGLTGNLTNNQPILIKGSGEHMLVKFQSDSVLSGRGFKATISYKPRGLGTWSFCSTTNLCQIDEGNCGYYISFVGYPLAADYECAGGLKCGHDNCDPNLELSHWVDCCYRSKWLSCKDSLDLEKGTLISPHHPNYYDPYEECSWLIPVPENYSVTLEFKTLSVSDTYLLQYQIRCLRKMS